MDVENRPVSYTDAEKLEVVERVITLWRAGRSSFKERVTYLILKAIADDIRGRGSDRASDTINTLAAAIERARKNRDENGNYKPGNLIEIANITIGRWPSIREGLERIIF